MILNRRGVNGTEDLPSYLEISERSDRRFPGDIGKMCHSRGCGAAFPAAAEQQKREWMAVVLTCGCIVRRGSLVEV